MLLLLYRIMVFLLIAIILLAYLRKRIEIVRKEMMRLLGEVDKKTTELINKGEKWEEPLKRFRKLNLNLMILDLFKFHWDLDLSDL